MRNFFKRNWIVILIFVLSLGLYSYSACRDNCGYGDSDEIITVSYLLSSAHPPGYPLQIILTKLFASLPLGGSYGFRANLLAGVLHSLTLVSLFCLTRSIIEWVNEDKIRLGEQLGVFLGVIFLALSAIFWLYASVLEVFALNDFLVILTSYLGFKWHREFGNQNLEIKNQELTIIKNKISKEKILLILVCMFLGIGLSHVQTFVMLFPGFLFLFILTIIKYKKFKEYLPWFVIGIIIFLVSFFGVNLLLFYLNSRQQEVSWWFLQNFAGWWFQIRRGAYAKKFVVGTGEMVSDSFWKAYWGGFDLAKYIITIPKYFGFLGQHLLWPGLILGFGGIYYLRKNKILLIFLFSLFLFSGLGLAMLMGVPECLGVDKGKCLMEIGISHRQYLQGEVLWGIFMCLGGVALYQFLINKIKNQENVIFIMIVSLLIFGSWAFFEHKQMGVNRNNNFANEFAKAILKDLPSQAILISSGDLPSMALFYVQEVEGVRKDVKILPRNRMIKKYYLEKNPEYYGYFFDNATEHMIDLIGFNMNKNRDVFIVDFSEEDAPFLGLGDSTYFIIPYGYVFKIVKEIPSEIPHFSYDLSQKLLDLKFGEKNYLRSVFSEYAVFSHINSAKLFSSMGLEEKALEQAKMVLKFKENNIAREILVNPLKFRNERYKEGSKVYEVDIYVDEAKKFLKENNSRQAYISFYMGLILDPMNSELRRMLADFYIKIGNPERASMHYEYLERNKGRL